MKYDKIRGNSIAELMMQLRSQFGNSVYILQTKEIRQGGLFGSDLLSRKQFEIEYMVSEDPPTAGQPTRFAPRPRLMAPENPVSRNRGASLFSGVSPGGQGMTSERNEMEASSPEKAESRSAKRPHSGVRPATAAIETNLHDLDTLIDSLKRLKDRSSRSADAAIRTETALRSEEGALEPADVRASADDVIVSARSLAVPSAKSPGRSSFEEPDIRSEMPTREELEALLRVEEEGDPTLRPRLSGSAIGAGRPGRISAEADSGDAERLEGGEDVLSRIRRRLLDSQASSAFVDRFMIRLERSLSEDDRHHPNRIRNRSIEKLKEMIRLTPTIEREHGERKVVFFVGPNGSGKTTSLAKIAARYQINEGASVTIVSLDHFRLAATEQLKTYAAVLLVPFHAPLSPSEFLELLDRDAPDYVFVDTSGMSLRDQDRLQDLRRYIEAVPGSVEVHLVLSGSTSPSLTEKYMDFFDGVGFEKIILTRLDEADFLANFVEAADKWKRPFSFLMNGQTVPEHVLHAESEDLARMVLGLTG